MEETAGFIEPLLAYLDGRGDYDNPPGYRLEYSANTEVVVDTRMQICNILSYVLQLRVEIKVTLTLF